MSLSIVYNMQYSLILVGAPATRVSSGPEAAEYPGSKGEAECHVWPRKIANI